MSSSGHSPLDSAAPTAAVAAPGRVRQALAAAGRGVRDWVDDAVRPNLNVRPVTRFDIGAVIGVWAIGRVLNITLLGAWFLLSKIFGWGFGPTGQHVRDFTSFLTSWDGERYGRIATIGYPPTLPTDISGRVVPNDWAFLPVFPTLERLVSHATGWGWELSGIALSVVFSGAATIMLFLLLRAVASPRAAWWAVVLFSFGPLSFVFVLAYAESLFLFILFGALLLAVRRQYAWIAPLGVLAAFVRPGSLALALALGILFLVRWFRRDVDPFPRRELVALFCSGIAIAIAGLSWSWIADAVTGTPHAYILTETAWWMPLVGDGAFIPLSPWFRFAGTYLGVFGIALVLALMALFALLVWSKPVRRLGIVAASFIFSYGLYLFGVFLPQQSTFRLMMPMAPVLAHERLSSTPRWRAATLGGAIGLQVVATLLLWTIGYP